METFHPNLHTVDLKTYDYDSPYSDVKDLQLTLTRLLRNQRTRRPQKKRTIYRELIVRLLRRLCKYTLDEPREVNLMLFISGS